MEIDIVKNRVKELKFFLKYSVQELVSESVTNIQMDENFHMSDLITKFEKPDLLRE